MIICLQNSLGLDSSLRALADKYMKFDIRAKQSRQD